MYNELKEIINNAKKIVVFTGAGLSTRSGIPDFRSDSGLYNQKTNTKYTPEEIISHSFFMKNTEEFYNFYFNKMVYKEAKPNYAHEYFSKLGEKKEVVVITQNIDNLHQMAGSKDVIELHGNVKRNYCIKCHKYYDIDDLKKNGVPRCICGGIIKPDVVLYEEELKKEDINNAIYNISTCDTLIVVGTSLTVYPAASFIRYFKGVNLVLINKTKTPYDNIANLVINDDIVDVLKNLDKC